MNAMLMNLGLAPIPATPTTSAPLADQYTKLLTRKGTFTPEARAKGTANMRRNRKEEKERKVKAVMQFLRGKAVTAVEVADAVGIGYYYAHEILRELCKEGKAKRLTGYTPYRFTKRSKCLD